jgi:hypothetical protein
MGSGGGVKAAGTVMTGAGTVVGGGAGGDNAIVEGETVAASAVDDTTSPQPEAHSAMRATRTEDAFQRSKVSALTRTVRRKIVAQ